MKRVRTSATVGRFACFARLLIAAFIIIGCVVDRGAQAQELLASAPLPVDAPALVLPTPDGETFSLETRKGKTTLVNFWALWCAPCIVEMPALGRLKGELEDEGLEVVAVNLGDKSEAIRRFLDKTDVGSLTIVKDRESVSQSTWQVPGLPATFLVNGDGQVTHLALGAREWDSDESIAWLRPLLTQ